MREIFLNWKIKKFSIPRTSFVVLGNLLGKTPILRETVVSIVIDMTVLFSDLLNVIMTSG